MRTGHCRDGLAPATSSPAKTSSAASTTPGPTTTSTRSRSSPGAAPASRAKVHLDRAVEGLRHAGQEEFITRGPLARAAFRRVHGDRTAAEADLDEAEEIAERGHMLLHLADVHLERTRLASGEDAGARRRLDAAVELVERCGYGRRRPDVAFLQEVLGGRSA